MMGFQKCNSLFKVHLMQARNLGKCYMKTFDHVLHRHSHILEWSSKFRRHQFRKKSTISVVNTVGLQSSIINTDVIPSHEPPLSFKHFPCLESPPQLLIGKKTIFSRQVCTELDMNKRYLHFLLSSSSNSLSNRKTLKKQFCAHSTLHTNPQRMRSQGVPDISTETSFLAKCSSCSTPAEILDLADTARNEGSLPMQHLATLFSCFQAAVYNQLTCPWLFPEPALKKKQLQANLLGHHLIGPFTSNVKFQHLINFTMTQINNLSISDCLSILQSLEYLFLSKQNLLFDAVMSVCVEDIESLNLQELAVLSKCFASCHSKDFATYSRIANAVKALLMPCNVLEGGMLGDLCEVLANIKPVVSRALLNLAAVNFLATMKHNSSNLTLDMLSKVCSFASIANRECVEILVNGILSFPRKLYQDVKIDNDSLTFEVCLAIRRNPWLCSVIHQIRAVCRKELHNAEDLSFRDVIRLSLPLNQIPACVPMHVYERCVSDSDYFLLFELMSHHLHSNLAELPEGQKLLCAYRNRLEKLPEDLNKLQLEELLWQNNEEWANVLYAFLQKMVAVSVRLKPKYFNFYTNLLRLTSNSWDASKCQVNLDALQAIEKLKTDTYLTSGNYPAVATHLVRLDFDHLMNIHNRLNSLILRHSTSQTIVEQAKLLQLRAEILFKDKLSRTASLSADLTNNVIWKGWRLRMHTRNGLFGYLLDALPRFTAGGDENDCLRALRILYWSAEKLPAYQEETFENLIRFLSSQPKLHVFSWIQLVKIIGFAGYQPSDGHSFNACIEKVVTTIIENDNIYKSMQVQMAYFLSLMGLFHDDFLLKIFSLEFMMELEEEFKDTATHKVNFVKNDLALLNQSVTLHCPHYALPWFASGLLAERSVPKHYQVTRLAKSIGRICSNHQAILSPAKSSYLHHIDALLCLDMNMVPVELDSDLYASNPDIHTKLAFLYLNPDNYCCNSDKLTGICQAKIRDLQILGYVTVLVSHREMSAKHFDERNVDDLMRQKISSVMGVEVFPDLSVYSEISEE